MLLDLKKIMQDGNLSLRGVIHVGAHFGEEFQLYKELGMKDVAFFEPSSKTFAELKRIVGNEAQLFNFALGNENNFIDMNIEKNDAFGCSSILNPSSNYSSEIFSGKERIEVRKLDDIELSGDFNFMNIDVQGYELQVLEGSVYFLEKIDYIMCEVNRKTPLKQLDYIGASLVEDVEKFLGNFGFKMTHVNWAGISWGDAFFVKERK